MTIIDPSTSLGKLRLRVSDWGDIPQMPDSVYLQTLEDNDQNVNRAAVTCALYLLGILSQRGHRKMGQLELWDNGKFDQYLKYLMLISKDPSFSGLSPIPFCGKTVNPIKEFVSDWQGNYTSLTQSEQMSLDASRLQVVHE